MAAPRRSDYKLLVPITVRWGDMDAYGHVNNAVFSTYFETARMKFFESVDIFERRENERHAPAIVSVTLNFRQQVHYPANLEAGIRCIKVGTKSFTLEHQLFRAGTDSVVADGTSVIAWVDYAAGAAIPIPTQLRAALESTQLQAGRSPSSARPKLTHPQTSGIIYHRIVNISPSGQGAIPDRR